MVVRVFRSGSMLFYRGGKIRVLLVRAYFPPIDTMATRLGFTVAVLIGFLYPNFCEA